jgi:hypothetical protein
MAASEAIVIDRVVSRADYFRLLMLLTLRKWYLIALILAAAALLITGIVLDAYPILFLFIFLFIIAYPALAGLKLIFDKRNKNVFLPARLAFTDEAIAVDSAASKGTVSWDAYHDWKKIGRFYILMVSSQTAHFIPGTGLSQQETERFETLLRTKIKDHRRTG